MTTIEALSRKEAHVGVVGLGYVGRPLAAALHRHFSVYGFDTDALLIRALRGEAGATRAPNPDASRLRGMGDRLTADPAVLGKCSFIVVTVPTPITADRVPDLTPLRAAARSIGRNLKPGCVVVVESTVYPGVTEEVVGPIIARESGLEAGIGFHQVITSLLVRERPLLIDVKAFYDGAERAAGLRYWRL